MVILAASNTSINHVGNGTIITSKIPNTAMASKISDCLPMRCNVMIADAIVFIFLLYVDLHHVDVFSAALF